MLRLKKPLSVTTNKFLPRNHLKNEIELFAGIPLQRPSQWRSCRFLDIYQMGNKEAIAKERARLKDEMNRGYFADMAEMKQHGGKIAMANKIITPAMAALKFPTIEVNYSDGSSLKLPITPVDDDNNASKFKIPKATLLCLSFRASSQSMVDSWSSPFLNTFGHSKEVQLYEISLIDSWILSYNPIKKLLLKIMRKPKPEEMNDVLQRQIVYSFGDNYYFRKELKILNLLTGYIFLLDKMGKIRWQGFGSANQEELASLLSCTALLMDDK